MDRSNTDNTEYNTRENTEHGTERDEEEVENTEGNYLIMNQTQTDLTLTIQNTTLERTLNVVQREMKKKK